MPTKSELIEKLAERDYLMLRMDTVIADLRYRNADLRNAASEISEEFAELVSPDSIPDRRFNKIWRLTETVLKIYKETPNDPSDPTEFYRHWDQLQVIAKEIEEYFSTYYENRQKKQLTPEHIAAMQKGRREKNV